MPLGRSSRAVLRSGHGSTSLRRSHRNTFASGAHLDLGCVPYVSYGGKYIDLVSPTPFSGCLPPSKDDPSGTGYARTGLVGFFSGDVMYVSLSPVKPCQALVLTRLGPVKLESCQALSSLSPDTPWSCPASVMPNLSPAKPCQSLCPQPPGKPKSCQASSIPSKP